MSGMKRSHATLGGYRRPGKCSTGGRRTRMPRDTSITRLPTCSESAVLALACCCPFTANGPTTPARAGGRGGGAADVRVPYIHT